MRDFKRVALFVQIVLRFLLLKEHYYILKFKPLHISFDITKLLFIGQILNIIISDDISIFLGLRPGKESLLKFVSKLLTLLPINMELGLLQLSDGNWFCLNLVVVLRFCGRDELFTLRLTLRIIGLETLQFEQNASYRDEATNEDACQLFFGIQVEFTHEQQAREQVKANATALVKR